MKRPVIIAALAALAALLITSPLSADSLDIGPTRIQMVGDERTATITIRNSNSVPANIQVRVTDWSQADGTDQYVPSQLLLASPPQTALAPGESQVIRLVIEKLPSEPVERAFRLVIDQIPSEERSGGAGVRTAIRALVPVFVTASTQDRPRLRWEAVRAGSSVVLTAINDGVAHDRLIGATVSTAGNPFKQSLEGYVLAQAKRSWTIANVPAQARMLQVVGEGEFGQVRADVPLAR